MDSVDAFCLEAGPSKQLLKAYSFIVELLWDVGYVADMLLGSLMEVHVQMRPKRFVQPEAACKVNGGHRVACL